MEKSDFITLAGKIFSANGLSPEKETVERLFHLTEIILEKNKVMNLTAICSEEEFISRHWADALLAEKYVPQRTKVLDVGTGAGILAFAYAAARPDISVTALDATAKKVNFINETAKTLGISNIFAVSGRAEELSAKSPYRESFDFVCARAVASMPVLCELCLPFVKIGGTFCALKGKNAAEELASAENAVKILGGGKSDDIALSLAEFSEDREVFSDRHIILTKKISATPKIYPRRFAQISKNPL